MKCWGTQLDDSVYSQIVARETLIGEPNKTVEQLQYLNSNTAWVMLRSGIDYENDGGKLARKYVLCGGTLQASAEGFTVREGIDFGSNYDESAYVLDPTLGFRPMSGITSVNITQKDTWGAVKEAVVNFQVWSLSELKNIDILFFKPGFPALLEYGHTCYVGDGGVVEPISFSMGSDLISNSTFFDEQHLFAEIESEIKARREQYKNNYQGFVGLITNFSYSLNDKGGYDCTVKLLSKGATIPGIAVAGPSSAPAGDDEDESESQDEISTSAYHNILRLFNSISISKWGKRESKTFEEICKLAKNSNNYKTTLSTLTLDDDADTESGDGFNMFKDAKVLRLPVGWRIVGAKKNVFTYYMSLGTLLELINRVNGSDYEKTGIETKSGRKMKWIQNLSYKSGYNRNIEFKDGDTGNKDVNVEHFITFPSHFSIDPIAVIKTSVPEEGIPVTEKIKKNRKFSNLTLKDAQIPAISGFRPETILNLCINFNAFVGEISNTVELKAEGFNIHTVLETFIARIQKALGNINNFKIVPIIDDETGVEYFAVVDANAVNSIESKDLKRIHISGLKSTVHSVTANSEISPRLADEVSIAATGTDSSVGDLVKWGEGCTPRHKLNADKPKVSSTEDKDKPVMLQVSGSVEYEKEALKGFCKSIGRFYRKINNRSADSSDGALAGSENLASENQLVAEDLFRKFVKINSSGVDAGEDMVPCCGILPIKVNLTMKGLGGILVGETFGIEPGILPDKYDNWGYIITKVSDEINSSGWKTSLETQYFPTKDVQITANSASSVKSQVSSVPTEQQAETSQSVDTSNNDNSTEMTLERAKNIVGPYPAYIGGKCGHCANYTGRIAYMWQQNSETSPAHVGGNAYSDQYSNFIERAGYSRIVETGFTGTGLGLNKELSRYTEIGTVLQYWTNEKRTDSREPVHYHACIKGHDGVWYSDYRQNNVSAYTGDSNTYTWKYRVFSPKDKSRYS